MRFKELRKLGWVAIAASLLLFIGTAPLAAGGSRGPKAKPSNTRATTTTSHANTTTHGSHGTTKKTTGASKAARTTGSKGTTSNSGDNTASNGGTSTTTTPSKAQQLLAKNTRLRTKLQSRLPEGTNINDAAAGFNNLGQFVAAVNVSNNLGIPFADLKAKMTGTSPVSLGQAIQQLKGMSATNANTTAQTALNQANGEIASTSGAPSTTNGTNTNRTNGSGTDGNRANGNTSATNARQ